MQSFVHPLQEMGQEHLVEKLTKNVGFGMGLEFREASNVLSAGSEVPVKAGMVFNVSVGKCTGLHVAMPLIPQCRPPQGILALEHRLSCHGA